jgi:chloramphenicol-sensitive protein RarD
MDEAVERRSGLIATASAFLIWGVVPVYWKAVAAVGPVEMVAHRVVWAALVMTALSRRRGRLGEVRAALADRRHRWLLGATSALVAGNWLVFIWAVQHGHVLQSSLGYYVNPLVNVLLGVVVLGERLPSRQRAAVALATVAVGWLAVSTGAFPWIALTLAFSFGLYGLLRKMARVDALVGLTVETWLLAPVGLVVLVVGGLRGSLAVRHTSLGYDALVAASGLVTAVPLLWFANAARRLRYATLGFFQYLTPTGHLLLAVGVYGEAFTSGHAVAFGLIGLAVVLYLADAARGPRVIGGSPVGATSGPSDR